ncbi:tyrosine recombinase [Bacteroidia bacterium]|nr:tyrosine recombinase [Bacteroidia bacterium]
MQNTRSTFSVLFYLNTGKTKKSGKCPLMGRISVDGKNTAFSTGMDICPADWDANTGTATGKSKEVSGINSQIEKYKCEIAGYYQNMLENRGYITAESLKNALQGIGTKQNSVMQEFAALLEEKAKSAGILITDSAVVKYRVAYRHFKDFLRERQHVDDIPFGRVDIELVESFALYMKIDLRFSATTVRVNMKIFRTLVKRAYSRRMLRQDPFLDYVPERIPVRRRWISAAEIERIMSIEMGYPSLDFTKDMFVFACFTGISYVDLYNLKHDNIQTQEDGSRMLIFKRHKTGVNSCVPLLSIPQAILEKYRDSQFTGWGGKIFRLQTLTGMDKHLKQIAKAAKVDKRLSFHMGRHSYATTVCLTNGVPIETLSRMLGHASIYTTQIYAEVTRTKINEDMSKLEKQIEGKYELAETVPNRKRKINH